MNQPPFAWSWRLTRSASVFLLVCVTLCGCHPRNREQASASASDEWTRSYPLVEGGRVSIANRDGAIHVQGGKGSTVEVRAERIVKAASEQTAKDLLPRIAIEEVIKPDAVSVQTKGIEGILLGVSFDVTYHVTVPAWANVRTQTVNGDVTVDGIEGRLVANTTNGKVSGKNLAGGVEARTTNGDTVIDVANIREDPIVLRATNGSIKLSLPSTADANVLATSTNGEVSITGFAFEPTGEQGPERGRNRRVRGRLNQGGPSIELQTTNGGISVTPRSAAAESPR